MSAYEPLALPEGCHTVELILDGKFFGRMSREQFEADRELAWHINQAITKNLERYIAELDES